MESNEPSKRRTPALVGIGRQALQCACARLLDLWRELKRRGAAAQLVSRDGLALVSLALLLCGLAILASPPGLPHALLVMGALLAAVCVHNVHKPFIAERGEADALGAVGERLERRIEELKDITWELRDNETRYRDLLDAQGEIISRRDMLGRLTFVNKAFSRTFGLEAKDVLGKDFRPVVLAEDKPTGGADAPRRNYARELETREGARWFAFEEHTVPGTGGTGYEVQSIGRDITEQRRHEAALADARDQAQAANRAKSRFLAAMSHEIRTPMNGILGMAGLLAETELSAEQQTYAQAIDQSAKTLLILIDEILDFSKIEAGKLALVESPFALDACVQSAVELLAPSAHEKSLEIAWTMDPALPARVLGDEARVRQILLNLIGNAVKFTDRGGVLVSVGLASDGKSSKRIRIAVKDTGIGLSRQAMDGLFAEFGQPDAPMSQRRGGTGLGLAISQRLAHALGGSISVASEPGRGATFTVDLPLKPVAGVGPVLPAKISSAHAGRVMLAFDRLIERRALATSLRAVGLEVEETDAPGLDECIAASAAHGKPIGLIIIDANADPAEAGRALARARAMAPDRSVGGILLIDTLARAGMRAYRAEGFDAYLVRPVRPLALLAQLGMTTRTGAAQPAPAPPPAQPMPRQGGGRVLLAEDNAVNALLARRLLEKLGFDVVHVGDGEQAVEAMRGSLSGGEPAFDLVFMDVHMPKLDGLEATGAIRRLATEGTPLPPIIAVTANAFDEDRQRCLAAGLDDYLAKPFHRDDLERLLDRWRGKVRAA